MPLDLYENDAPTQSTSAIYGEAVTPHDVNLLNFPTKWIYATGEGVVTCQMKQADGTFAPIAFPITAGAPLLVRTNRIMATGTTATGLVACH